MDVELLKRILRVIGLVALWLLIVLVSVTLYVTENINFAQLILRVVGLPVVAAAGGVIAYYYSGKKINWAFSIATYILGGLFLVLVLTRMSTGGTKENRYEEIEIEEAPPIQLDPDERDTDGEETAWVVETFESINHG